MSEVVIKVENLSKKYIISHENSQSYTALRDVISHRAKKFLKRTKKELPSKEEFWALNDISFEVRKGDAIGIIGKNGAGKSTLLKVLSRITEPSKGRIAVHGRIASLLEVGTGFHPELTGRENIFLNGAILGMTRVEIKKKFDEIVDFSGVEKFLDTPVKRYSSGMYVRLAFAIAAFLEPEILIIDEVLAVGDAEFQKKCLGRMDEVSQKEGRTVLFVSHQMGTIAQLCKKAILLKNGKISSMGETREVIDLYQNSSLANSSTFENRIKANKDLYIKRASVLSIGNESTESFRHDEEIVIKIIGHINNYIKGVDLRMEIRDNRQIRLFTTDVELAPIGPGVQNFEAVMIIPANLLRPSLYSLSFALLVPHQLIIDIERDVLSFSVYDAGTKYAQSEGMDYGLISSPCQTYVQPI
jgi:lipopolysaccharide transport system ATP-binding protein